jgi:hypothetical protein
MYWSIADELFKFVGVAQVLMSTKTVSQTFANDHSLGFNRSDHWLGAVTPRCGSRKDIKVSFQRF